ncbi:MAG: cation diffusion facilitator family transporter [Candidatus Marinimicrobia bacterium]|nr:cation diffusion facilitator family transporter [Candidatus Neomarinimicrobiota bacterium]MCF7829155.1 cation diffusion facilitator family transporter [Candidatus Neomarinimicrobiota bacterium]MCF7881192.1 cation diffusion facilitator family transporter [Candidatus Neomarinimicrobiota bacterium]
MERLTKWIANRFIKDADNVTDGTVREHYGLLEGWVSIVLNFFLFVFKLIIGLTVNSLALIADAIHSLSDTATSIVVIVGFKISNKPPDREHPYGHGRAEYIATLIISILLVVTGIEFIQTGIKRIAEPVTIQIGIPLLAAVVFTIVIKEMMGQFSKHLGDAIDSDTLAADSWHHRTDAISSALVLVALIAGMFGLPSLDGVASLGVAGVLIYTGYDIARNAIDSLLGKPPKPELVRKIRRMAKEVEYVLDAHDIVVHNYGQGKFINLHIEVDESINPMLMHDTAEAVENCLGEALNAYALVHLDPIAPESEYVQRVRNTMNDIQEREPDLKGFHEVRVVDHENRHVAIMDVMLSPELSTTESQQYIQHLKSLLKDRLPDIEFRIQVTPLHRFK